MAKKLSESGKQASAVLTSFDKLLNDGMQGPDQLD